jgi:hypothetical protein
VNKESKLYRRVSTKGSSLTEEARRHHPSMRYLWSVHLRGCLRREVENLISIDEYALLTRGNCHYCNAPPTNWTKHTGSNHTGSNHIQYNGIDRVDNNLPYIMGNLVSCCKLCNGMKSGLTTSDFQQHVFDVADFLRSKSTT